MIRLRAGKGEHSPLWIWEYPEPDAKYYIGADAARGKEDGDFSAAVGWNGYTGNQAFSFADRRDVERFAFTLNLLGRFYNNAMMYPEQTGGDGAHVLKLLRDTHRYPAFAPWKGRDDKLRSKPSTTIGWETTWKSRQRLMVNFRSEITNGFLKIRDPRIVSQMGNAMRDDPMLRWEVTRGHDDLLMAAMIGAMAIAQWPPPKRNIQRSDNLLTRGDDAQPTVAFETEPNIHLRDKFHALHDSITKGIMRTDPLEGI